MHHIPSLKFPFQFPRRQIQRINIRIPTAKINRPAGNHRRRQIKIKRVRHQFRRWQRTMQMLPRKSPLALGLKSPFQFPGRSVQRIKIPVIAAKENQPRRNRRRRSNPALRLEFPFEYAAPRIQRIKKMIAAAHKKQSAGNHRRRNHRSIGMKLPLDLRELRHAGPVINARMRAFPRNIASCANAGEQPASNKMISHRFMRTPLCSPDRRRTARNVFNASAVPRDLWFDYRS